MAKKRIYKRSEQNRKFRKPKDKEKAIKYLEETGELNDNLSPYMINDRLVYQHDKIIRTMDLIEKAEEKNNEKRVKKLKCYKKEYLRKFFNLASIIIYANVKRYSSTLKQAEDLVAQSQLEIMEVIFEKRSYNKEKSMLSSQIFEISKQAIIKYISKEMKIENTKLTLLEN